MPWQREPLPFDKLRVGRQARVGKVRKPGPDTLHEQVFEDKTVKGVSGHNPQSSITKAGDFF